MTEPEATPRPDTVPDGLQLLLELVNSVDLENPSTDHLASPERAERWAAEKAPDAPTPREEELPNLRLLREALRDLALANHETTDADAGALDTINRVAEATSLRIRIEPAGVRLAAQDVAGRVLAILYTAMVNGTWPRFKACRNDSCRWAFYDQSRNRSRNWCSMQICGNRIKARQFRERMARGS